MVRELARVVDEYVVGLQSLRDFESWLAGRLRHIHQGGDAEAIALAEQIDADLIDFGEGLLDEAELRERLGARVRAVDTIVLQEPPVMQNTAEAITLRRHYQE